MSTGITCDDDIIASFEQFKLQQGDYKGKSFIIYKINDKKTKIIVEKTGEVGEGYDEFVESLPENEPRYGAIDIKFETDDGRETSKLVMITWIPDTGKIRPKMLYAGSKAILKSCLDGIGIMINANDLSDLDFESAIKPAVTKFA
jgi:cofilin